MGAGGEQRGCCGRRQPCEEGRGNWRAAGSGGGKLPRPALHRPVHEGLHIHDRRAGLCGAVWRRPVFRVVCDGQAARAPVLHNSAPQSKEPRHQGRRARIRFVKTPHLRRLRRANARVHMLRALHHHRDNTLELGALQHALRALTHEDPVREVRTDLQAGEGRKDVARYPRRVKDAGAVSFVCDWEGVAPAGFVILLEFLLKRNGPLKEPHCIIPRKPVCSGVRHNFFGPHRESMCSSHPFLEVGNVLLNVGAKREKEDDEFQVVLWEELDYCFRLCLGNEIYGDFDSLYST
mmetsp:Transcript_52405/g.131736  ORF Transcript_52405/g.131736 Transcript_52405/m.131736 type:complete len:292 (+) Transcript_52405:144-1019(+)